MPTTLPKPKPTTAAVLLQLTWHLVGAALLLVALGLLWLRLYKVGRRVGDAGLRIGG
jgi:hypothetical protein